jgi:hypothetical protein
MLILAIFIIAFFFFFGCPYEIINFYLSPSEEEDKPVKRRRGMHKERKKQHVRADQYLQKYEKAEKTENNPTTQELGQTGRCYNNELEVENTHKKGIIDLGKPWKNNPNDDAVNVIVEPISDENQKKEINMKTIIICIFLGLLGLVLQPFYLLFYIFVGVMECYRRFACWYFYF